MSREEIWLYKFGLLKDYLKENNKYPKVREEYKGIKIGTWINTLRNVYNLGKKQNDGSIRYSDCVLYKEQIDLLNSINFRWDSNYYRDDFYIKFKLLKEFIKEYDRYPKSNEQYKDKNIGRWINTLRTIRNNGKRQKDGSITYTNGPKLTVNQINMLDSINFEWFSNTHEKNWENNFRKLKKYLEENGEYPISRKDSKLTRWVNTQRNIYSNGELLENGSIKLNSNILTVRQIEMLNSIDFVWLKRMATYSKKEITDMEKTNRILLWKLKKILLEEKKFSSKEDVKKVERNLTILLK